MIQHKIVDLFACNADLIAHQVNCQGAMGSGVAKQIRMLFPGAYARYRGVWERFRDNSEKLLGTTWISVENTPDGQEVFIANMFAQDRYGYDGKRYTDYTAFRNCLAQLKDFADTFRRIHGKELQIAMPYRIGCDRGGGDWNIVSKIIDEELGSLNVTLCELPKK